MTIPPESPHRLTGRVSILTLSLLLVGAAVFSSCDTLSDAEPGGAAAPIAADAESRRGSAPGTRWAGPDTPALAEVAVMSQNLYLGGPIFRLIEDEDCAPTPEGPLPLLRCVDEVYGEIVASDFPTRAEAIADEIARVRPALVGLQEVSTYTLNSAVAIDFLELLLGALSDRGLDYTEVSENVNLALELPALTEAGGRYRVGYQDADVVLALDDPDVETGAVDEVTFQTLLPFTIAGTSQTLGRGYQTVEATVDGFSFTFVNTHLEVAEFAPVRDAQAAQLDAALAMIEGPVVLVGDLNGAPDESEQGGPLATDPYAVLTESLTDVYDRPNLQAQPTCCQAADLRNEASALDKRIDYVLYQGFDRVKKAETVLDEPGDRVESGGDLLWPSDHAGVAALLVYNLRRARR